MKTPIQKGPIECEKPTYRNIKPEVRALQDYEDHVKRRDMKHMTLHEPKPKHK